MTSRIDQVPSTAPASNMALPQARDFAEMGVIDDLPFSGGFGKFSRELIDPSEISVEDIRKMYRRDGQVRSIYRLLSLPIRTLHPVFTPREGSDGSDGEKEAEFVTDAFTKPPQQGGMTSSFSRVLTQMTKALADGFSCFEKVWHVMDGQFVYRKFAPRAADTIKFLLDDTGGLQGVRQRVTWQGKRIDVVIPASKLLVYTAQHEENPFYGESYLLPAHYHYDLKTKLSYIGNLAYQFHAVPGRVGSYPQDADPTEKTGFRQALASFGFNTAMTKPDNYTVEEFGGKGTMPDLKQMLDYQDTQMAKSVLTQFIQLGSGSETGSWALSTDQSDMFTMSLQAVADEMAEVVSFYAVPQLVDFNFGSNAYPVCGLGPLADATKDMMAEVFKEIADAASMNVTPEFMFELEVKVAEALELEIDYEALREEMKARAEEERELAIAAQQALLEGANRPREEGEEEEEETEPNLSVAAAEVVSLMEVLKRRRRRR